MLSIFEWQFIGLVLEGFCFGLYSGIFFMYIQYQASKKVAKNVIFYALCILYVLSVATIAQDATSTGILISSTIDSQGSGPSSLAILHLSFVSITITGLCDFISQAILIYRCWVVWGRNIRVIIIPSFLVVAFLAIWLAVMGSFVTTQSSISVVRWGFTLSITSLALSLTLNAAVTGIIMFRILKVYRQVRSSSCSDQTLSSGVHNPALRSIIFAIIESGMVLFAVQLIRIVLYLLQLDAYEIMVGTNEMFNGITPTLILVRVSAGLSFHDEKSMSDIVETLRFGVSYSEDSISETEDVEIMGLESLDHNIRDVEI